MSHFIDVLGPHYQDLLAKCEKRKISVNLDIQDLTINIREVKRTNEFLTSEIKRALRNCGPGDKITLAEANDSQTIRISVKNSGRALLQLKKNTHSAPSATKCAPALATTPSSHLHLIVNNYLLFMQSHRKTATWSDIHLHAVTIAHDFFFNHIA